MHLRGRIDGCQIAKCGIAYGIERFCRCGGRCRLGLKRFEGAVVHCYFGWEVGDAFVAINTGLFFLNAHLVHFAGISALRVKIHRIHAMTATTGCGVAGFQLRPNGLRHLQTMFFKLLWRVDFFGDELMIDIFRGKELGYQVIHPAFRDMAIRAFCTNPLLILEVNRARILLIRRLHRMARQTKFSARCFM